MTSPTTPAQPMQPIVIAEDGCVRFMPNAIVAHLLTHGGLDMNELALVEATPDDRQQFAQLIGYSVSGYGDLSYASTQVYDAACKAAAALRQKPYVEPARVTVTVKTQQTFCIQVPRTGERIDLLREEAREACQKLASQFGTTMPRAALEAWVERLVTERTGKFEGHSMDVGDCFVANYPTKADFDEHASSLRAAILDSFPATAGDGAVERERDEWKRRAEKAEADLARCRNWYWADVQARKRGDAEKHQHDRPEEFGEAPAQSVGFDREAWVKKLVTLDQNTIRIAGRLHSAQSNKGFAEEIASDLRDAILATIPNETEGIAALRAELQEAKQMLCGKAEESLLEAATRMRKAREDAEQLQAHTEARKAVLEDQRNQMRVDLEAARAETERVKGSLRVQRNQMRVDLEAARAETERVKGRLRVCTQQVVDAIGASGPESLEGALGRLLLRLRIDPVKIDRENRKTWIPFHTPVIIYKDGGIFQRYIMPDNHREAADQWHGATWVRIVDVFAKPWSDAAGDFAELERVRVVLGCAATDDVVDVARRTRAQRDEARVNIGLMQAAVSLSSMADSSKVQDIQEAMDALSPGPTPVFQGGWLRLPPPIMKAIGIIERTTNLSASSRLSMLVSFVDKGNGVVEMMTDKTFLEAGR